MEPDQVPVETRPAAQDVQFLEERIYEYNVARTGIGDGELLSMFVRGEQGEIIAGLFGWTWGGCCEIRSLWVREDARGRGYGTALLRAAEREAAARGCDQVVLDTHSFQAPLFYQRHGYEIVGAIEGYPRGHRKYYLRKALRLASDE